MPDSSALRTAPAGRPASAASDSAARSGPPSKPTATPVHTSLTRPVLLAGAQRELALANLVLILGLLFGTPPSPVTWGLAALLGTAGHALLVKLARLDETGWQVFVRHLRYQAYYPALSPQGAPPTQIPPAVPRR